jgi:hypothetical protein
MPIEAVGSTDAQLDQSPSSLVRPFALLPFVQRKRQILLKIERQPGDIQR